MDVTAQIIAAAVALLLALIGGAAGWIRSTQHGAETERRKRAEEDRDEAQDLVAEANAPPASPSEASDVLRRRLARVARRLERMRSENRRDE